MNKRMQKIKDKVERKKEILQKVSDVQDTTPQRRSSIDSRSSIIHKNLFDSSAPSEANGEYNGRKNYYKEGKYRPKDLKLTKWGSKKENPRLRTKTRSKAKNFKRDTRTNE